MKRRFIGPVPFSYDDQPIYFGRKEEIKYLSTLILNNKTTVIHGKSGLGKSSLINAGVIPFLFENYSCEIIRIRFYNSLGKERMSPKETLVHALNVQLVNYNSKLGELLGPNTGSAWRCLKELHWRNYSTDRERMKKESSSSMPAKPNEPDDINSSIVSGNSESISYAEPADEERFPDKNYILIFDQFEEIFKYDAAEVQEFGKELQEMLCNIIPEEQAKILKSKFSNRELVNRYREELTLLEKEIPLRLVFSIRADQFNYMTHLIPYVPDLLKNTFKISRMDAAKVKQTISEPTRVPGKYTCPPFIFDPALVDEIVDYLAQGSKEAGQVRIEIFEMQIICQKLENAVTELLKKRPATSSVLPVFKRKELLDKLNVEDKEPFAAIIKNYYKDTIESIKDEGEMLSARFLIERKLIDPFSRKRISLDSSLITQLGLQANTLRLLLLSNIIRTENNTVSGNSYEISHDTLVTAILMAALEMNDLDALITRFFENALKGKNRLESKLLKKLTIQAGADDVNGNGIELYDRQTILKAISDSELFVNNPHGHLNPLDGYTMKETFQHASQQARERSQKSYTDRLTKNFFFGMAAAIIVVVGLLFFSDNLIRKANRSYSFFYLAYTVDTLKDKEAALRLAGLIRSQHRVFKEDSFLFNKKSLAIFQTQEIQGKLSLHTDTLPVTSVKSDRVSFSSSGKYKMILLPNGDSTQSVNGSDCILSDIQGTMVRRFEKVNYAYFVNEPDILLCSFSTGRESTRKNALGNFERSNTFILYDCNKKSVIDSVQLGASESLFPSPYVGVDFGSRQNPYTVKMFHHGEVLIPFVKESGYGTMENWFKLKKQDGKVVTRPFFNNAEISPDKSFVLGDSSNQQFSGLLDVNGKIGKPVQHSGFIGFTQKNSIMYSSGTNLYLIDKDSTRHFVLTDDIDWADADRMNENIIVKTSTGTAVIHGSTGMADQYNEELIGYNFNAGSFTTLIAQQGLNLPPILTVRYFNNNQVFRREWAEKFISMKYNSATGDILFVTDKYKFVVLNQHLATKAALQLTANDIAGFSPDGSVFYYIRDQYFSVFLNRGPLVDFFNAEKSFQWLDSTHLIKPLSEEDRKSKYKLRFTRQIFWNVN